MLPQAAGDLWPTVITVSPANNLLQIVNGGIPQVLLPAQSFPMGAHLEHVQNGPHRLVLPPATVTLINSVTDPLVVQIVQIAGRLKNPGAVMHFPKPVDQP